MAKIFANSGDPDQMSDLGLHCLPITLIGVSRLQWVKVFFTKMTSLHKAKTLGLITYHLCTLPNKVYLS